MKKSGITLLLCALLLAGCQLYWRKPGANLAAFTADHQTCVAKAGTDVAADQGLVLHVYRAYSMCTAAITLPLSGRRFETRRAREEPELRAGDRPSFRKGRRQSFQNPHGRQPVIN